MTATYSVFGGMGGRNNPAAGEISLVETFDQNFRSPTVALDFARDRAAGLRPGGTVIVVEREAGYPEVMSLGGRDVGSVRRDILAPEFGLAGAWHSNLPGFITPSETV